MTQSDITRDRPLTVARRSLVYVAAYSVGIGGGLLFAPGPTLGLLLSTGDYGNVFPRVAGLLMIGLGLFVVQIVRLRLEALYPTTLYVRAVILCGLTYLYVVTLDPLFLTIVTVVGLGMVLTTASYTIDHSRARRSGAGAQALDPNE